MTLDTLKARYADLYNDKLGTLSNFKTKLHLTENVVPIFMRARPVPYAMHDRIEVEQNQLEIDGVLSKIAVIGQHQLLRKISKLTLW